MIRIVTRRRLAVLEARLAAVEAQREAEAEARVAAASRAAVLAVELSATRNRAAGLQKRIEEREGDLGAAELHIEQLKAALRREEARAAGLEEDLEALRADTETDLRGAAAQIGELEREVAAERQERAAADKHARDYRELVLHLVAHPETRSPLLERTHLALGDDDHARLEAIATYYAETETS